MTASVEWEPEFNFHVEDPSSEMESVFQAAEKVGKRMSMIE